MKIFALEKRSVRDLFGTSGYPDPAPIVVDVLAGVVDGLEQLAAIATSEHANADVILQKAIDQLLWRSRIGLKLADQELGLNMSPADRAQWKLCRAEEETEESEDAQAAEATA